MAVPYTAPAWYLKVLWYVVVFVILALMIVGIIVFYRPIANEYPVAHTVLVVIFALINIALYRSYGRYYYKSHPKQQRGVIIFISSALTLLISMITFNLIWGSPQPYLPYLWISLILLVFIGAFIGDRIALAIQKHN
jgi:hypothetical protein